MSYIYKIVNDINNKVYIGKTNLSIQERFQQHCRDYKKITEQHRPLYQSMAKYGVEHFHIELIEKCLPTQANEREQYWIGYYKGYEKGYNATKGGDGKIYLDYNTIIETLKINPYPSEVAKLLHCSADSVRAIAKEYNIPIKHLGQEKNVNPKKTIYQYDKQTNQYIQQFESTQLAAQWLYKQGIILTINSGVRSHICEVATGKRKSAYGYIWKYE